MKKMKIIFTLAMSLVVIFGFYGLAFSGGGGPEDPGCQVLPDPTSGPYIWGTFTASEDTDECSQSYPGECAHINVHVELHRFCQVHLYSFPASTCDLCESTASDFKTWFAGVPCTLGVGQDFGLDGVPVIKNLMITKSECSKNMIKGIITIRVVPLP